MVFILSGGVQLTDRETVGRPNADGGWHHHCRRPYCHCSHLPGGLWAVNITDFVQFVILIAICVVVLPLSLNLVGGVVVDRSPTRTRMGAHLQRSLL